MPSLPSRDGGRPHILAINNDPAILDLYRDVLEDEGYRVTTQSYVDHDLTRITTLAPRLIMLDYMWATEDASWSLLQMLRFDPATAAIPLILCTGAVREVEALRPHLEAMAIAIVLKPFSLAQLVEAIQAHLGPNPVPRHGTIGG